MTQDQAEAVRAVRDAALDAATPAGELHVEVEAHGRRALAFFRAVQESPEGADPGDVREGLARVELLHEQLGRIISAQRSALAELNARIV